MSLIPSLPTKEDRLNQRAERVHSTVQGVDYHTVDDILEWQSTTPALQTVAGTVSKSDQWLSRVGQGVVEFFNRNGAALVSFGAGCAVGFLLRGNRER